MPVYCYECQNPKCAYTFEIVQTFSEKQRKRCPKCQHKVMRVYGNANVVTPRGAQHHLKKQLRKPGRREKALEAVESMRRDEWGKSYEGPIRRGRR